MSFKANSKRMRTVYGIMTLAEKDCFLDSITNEVIVQEIKKIEDIKQLTLFTEEEYIANTMSSSTAMKQHRLRRFLETGRLKNFEEDDILPVTTINSIHNIMLSNLSEYAKEKHPEYLI